MTSTGCRHQSSTNAASAPTGREPFVEKAAEAGVDFVHFNGMTGHYLFPEIKGMGGALLDYDNDGDLDLYLMQGRLLEEARAGDVIFPPPNRLPPGDNLYRNDLVGGQGAEGELHFTDVTEESGIVALEYGQGVATGDYDNDGWVDLYVSNFGPNQLFRNRGDGSFEDVSERAGVGDPGWGASTTFVDVDHDGWLDLYVVNYLQYRLANQKTCRSAEGLPDYCGPLAYQPAPDRLFRNRGDGTFQDISGPAGIHTEAGSGLGVAAGDFTGDGRVDIYVANDERVNYLWVSHGDGTFVNGAAIAGVAANMNGTAESSMGVGIGDMDNDGDEDIFLTHLTDETNTFYENLGDGFFEDRSIAVRLGPQSLLATGFGTVVLDYDNDGWLDIFAANGAVNQRANARARMLLEESKFPYEQPNQLFRNLGDGSFLDVTHDAGEAFRISLVSRGASGAMWTTTATRTSWCSTAPALCLSW